MRLSKFFIALIAIAYASTAQAQLSEVLTAKLQTEILSQVTATDTCCTVSINDNDYYVTVVDNEITKLRKPIFSQAVRDHADNGILNFVEEAYAYNSLGIKSKRFEDIRFTSGKWSDLNGLSDTIPCTINIENANIYTITLGTDNGDCVITFPVEYDKINGESRTGIENDFIKGLKRFKPVQRKPIDFTIKDLDRIDNNLFVLHRGTYMIPGINQDIYIEADPTGEAVIIENPEMPASTLANMINAGVGYTAMVDMNILKHEYGEKETLTLPLETILQYCMANGCDVYWGLESLNDTELKGTIFCYNKSQGYDHLLRVECDPSKLGNDDFVIKARTSLYIPTHNVSNLLDQHNPESGHEKFKVKIK